MADDHDDDEVKSIKGWVKKTMLTLAGSAVIAAAVWAGSFISDSAQAAADKHITAVLTSEAPTVFDPVYLKKTEFNQYQQAQVIQSNESELRRIQQEITRLDGEIKYGNLTDARKAQEELQLQLLQTQQEELLRKLKAHDD